MVGVYNWTAGTSPKQQRALPVESKAIALDRDKLALLPQREQLMTELRASFGLRTEEACKFQHDYAMNQRAGSITLKGGRERYIQIANEQQRDLLERFQREYGDKSMIPKHRRFKSFYRDYNEARKDAGIPGHELRHEWAQRRFKDLAGIEAPHAGGRRMRICLVNNKRGGIKLRPPLTVSWGMDKDGRILPRRILGLKGGNKDFVMTKSGL